MAEPFRIEFVPGVTPDKWVRIWAARLPDSPLVTAQVEDAEQLTGLHHASTSMCFVRLPVEREGLHVIPLYSELPVVVVARDHPVAAFDEVEVADLADEHLLQDPDTVPEWRDVARPPEGGFPALTPMTVKQAISVVAAGSGIVIVPMSVARLHHRKDVVHRLVREVAESQVGLAWRREDDDPRIEAFIGIVRGRTERSTRGSAGAGVAQDPGERSGGGQPRQDPSRATGQRSTSQRGARGSTGRGGSAGRSASARRSPRRRGRG